MPRPRRSVLLERPGGDVQRTVGSPPVSPEHTSTCFSKRAPRQLYSSPVLAFEVRGPTPDARFTAWPGGNASLNSRTLRLRTGCRTSGAISASGSSTKRRSCMAGCGMVKTFGRNHGISKQQNVDVDVARAFLAGAGGPSSCSMASTPSISCRGVFSCPIRCAQFRNHGWAVSSTGSVS